MKIVINGKEVALREKEVRIAKKAINRLLQTMKEGAVENNIPTLYVAVLAVMKVKATELLNSLDPVQLEEVMQLLEGQKTNK